MDAGAPVGEVDTGPGAGIGAAGTETGAGVPVRGVDAGLGAGIGVAGTDVTGTEKGPGTGLVAGGEALGREAIDGDGLLPNTRRTLSLARTLNLLSLSPNSIVVE